ncbi:MAG: DUF433 domain-containing protein [Dehalococcoidia bacterium]
MTVVNVGEHLVIDPEFMHGRLTFRGTRVPVSTVLIYLAKGRSLSQVVEDWPQLRPEAVQEAIRLASEALERQYEAERTAAECEARRLRDEQLHSAAAP